MNLHRLLRLAQAVQTGQPMPAGRYRHTAHGLHTTDPVLWAHPLVHLGEPFTFGALACGPVDPATGHIGPISVHVADQPLDQQPASETFAAFGATLTSHLDGGFLGRRHSDGQPVAAHDRHVAPSHLPRILITGSRALEVLGRLGRKFAHLPASHHPDPEPLRHAGRWLRELDVAALRAGQSLIIDLAAQLRETYIVPLPSAEQDHAGALVAAIRSGPQAAWQAEQVAFGPTVDVETADRLWATHSQLQVALRAGNTTVARQLRADLHSCYAQLARTAADTTSVGLQLLDAVEEDPRFADARNREDTAAYLQIAGFLHGHYQGRRRPVGTITANAAALRRRETARQIHNLRRDATEPARRCHRWAGHELVEGTRTHSDAQRIPTGARTPTGKTQTTVAANITIELTDRIQPPPAGTRLLWAGDDRFQTVGNVTAISGRTVTIRVVGRGSRTVTAVQPSSYDIWLPGRPPFTGPSTWLPAAELPLTHRDPDGEPT